MADYYTQFSFEVKNVSEEGAEWLKEEAATRKAAYDQWDYRNPDPCPVGADFGMEIHDGTAWFHDDGCGEVDQVTDLVQAYLLRFDPLGVVGFEYSHSCSKPRLDAYGGGAVLIRATSVDVMTSYSWLQDALRGDGLVD